MDEKVIKISPCCRAKLRLGVGDHWETLHICSNCNKRHIWEDLLEVRKGFNPITYMCDECHKKLEDSF